MKPQRRFSCQRGGKPTKSGLKKVRKRGKSNLGVGKNAEKGDNVDCKA